MATKWMHPRFIKVVNDELMATDAALPTSAEVDAMHQSSAYMSIWYVESA